MELELLRTISPAECLVLKEESSVRMRDILKFTLIDLVLKDVLRIGTKEARSDPRDPVRKNTYLFTGPNFKTYKPKPVENLFFTPFAPNPDGRFFLRTYVKIVVQEAGDQDHFIRKFIKRSPEISKNLKHTFRTWLQSKVELNATGRERSARLKKELDTLHHQMPELIKYENRDELCALTQSLSANIFLLDVANPGLMNEIDEAIHRSIAHVKQGTVEYGNSYDYYWPYYSAYDATFNSGFDAASPSRGSWGSDADTTGCGGCSGCSGCGGCGS